MTSALSFEGETFAADLSAGVARIDLTPPMEMNSPLGGYGERMNRPAEGVHDRIFAKALVLSDGEKKFALVTADMLGFAPAIKPAIVQALATEGWSSEKILLLASHSHASIEMNAINPQNRFDIPQLGIHDPKLYDFTVNNLVTVIGNAAKQLTPVTVGTSSQQLPGWNRNRRTRGGTTDDQLTITRIDTPDGKLPPQRWHPDFKETGGAEYGLTEEVLSVMLPQMFPKKAVSVSLRLGDLIVVGIPGEMAAELGLHIKTEIRKHSIKQSTPVDYVTIGGLADVWTSYILSAKEYRRGGYEASVSFYGETLGKTIVEGALNGAKYLSK